ncbi:hypothetical protein Ciccas_014522 [Cichlidogyrus casuarinus]|uniref:Uncharacterized protein n=1 Tax=Cichlidogyrus casuarinus TaxID=1844966 RepID=A0ABD2PJA7_9PLAT
MSLSSLSSLVESHDYDRQEEILLRRKSTKRRTTVPSMILLQPSMSPELPRQNVQRDNYQQEPLLRRLSSRLITRNYSTCSSNSTASAECSRAVRMRQAQESKRSLRMFDTSSDFQRLEVFSHVHQHTSSNTIEARYKSVVLQAMSDTEKMLWLSLLKPLVDSVITNGHPIYK